MFTFLLHVTGQGVKPGNCRPGQLCGRLRIWYRLRGEDEVSQDGVYPGREWNRVGVEMCDANVPTPCRLIRSFAKSKSKMNVNKRHVILASWIKLFLLYWVKKGNFCGIWYVRPLYLSKNRKYNIFHFSFKETACPFIFISSKLLKHCSLVKALLGFK